MNIQDFIEYAKKNGVELEPCPDFEGVRTLNGKPYFNVLTGERHWCSLKLAQLERLSNQYKTFTLEENGLERLAIFPA